MKLTNIKSLASNGGYESPQCSIVKIASESAAVLCVSQGTIEEWKDGSSFTWDE